MAVNYDAMLAAGVSDAPFGYGEDTAIQYALGVGFGSEGSDPKELDFLYEGRGLRTVPSMAAVLVGDDFLADGDWDPLRVSVIEQKLELYRPLPATADLRADQRVVAVLDHGRDVGVSVMTESEVRMAKDGTVLFTLGSTLLCGGPGGYGMPRGSGPLPHKLPEREPDLACEFAAAANQPYLFRLVGSRSSLYVDDAVASTLGHAGVPLQEQCTAGMACRAILQTICDYDFTLIAGFDLRFTGTVYPGDVLTTEMWQERNIVSFRSRVIARDIVVIDNGKCTLAV